MKEVQDRNNVPCIFDPDLPCTNCPNFHYAVVIKEYKDHVTTSLLGRRKRAVKNADILPDSQLRAISLYVNKLVEILDNLHIPYSCSKQCYQITRLKKYLQK